MDGSRSALRTAASQAGVSESQPRTTPLPPYSSFGFNTNRSRCSMMKGTRSPGRPPYSVRRSSLGVEQGAVALVLDHRQTGFLVQHLAAERVHHADGAVAHGPDGRMVQPPAGHELAEEHPFVDERDLEVIRDEPPAAVLHLTRIDDAARQSLRREVLLEEDELTEGRHVAPVEDGDPGHLAAAGPLDVGVKEGVEHAMAARQRADVVLLEE